MKTLGNVFDSVEESVESKYFFLCLNVVNHTAVHTEDNVTVELRTVREENEKLQRYVIDIKARPCVFWNTGG